MQHKKYTTTRQLGAMLKEEFSTNFCRTNGEFTNSGTTAVQLQPGTLFTGDTSAPSVFDTANVAAVTGVNITTALVEPGQSVFVATLTSGPAILNVNEMDFPADAAQTATIKTTLEGLSFQLVEGLPT